MQQIDSVFEYPLFQRGGWLIGALTEQSDVYRLAAALQNFIKYEFLDREMIEKVPLCEKTETWPSLHITLTKPGAEKRLRRDRPSTQS